MIATRGLGAGHGVLPVFGMGAGYGGAPPAPDEGGGVPNSWTMWQGLDWPDFRQDEEIIFLRRKTSSRAGV